jgi:hypothetical protein
MIITRRGIDFLRGWDREVAGIRIEVADSLDGKPIAVSIPLPKEITGTETNDVILVLSKEFVDHLRSVDQKHYMADTAYALAYAAAHRRYRGDRFAEIYRENRETYQSLEKAIGGDRLLALYRVIADYVIHRNIKRIAPRHRGCPLEKHLADTEKTVKAILDDLKYAARRIKTRCRSREPEKAYRAFKKTLKNAKEIDRIYTELLKLLKTIKRETCIETPIAGSTIYPETPIAEPPTKPEEQAYVIGAEGIPEAKRLPKANEIIEVEGIPEAKKKPEKIVAFIVTNDYISMIYQSGKHKYMSGITYPPPKDAYYGCVEAYPEVAPYLNPVPFLSERFKWIVLENCPGVPLQSLVPPSPVLEGVVLEDLDVDVVDDSEAVDVGGVLSFAGVSSSDATPVYDSVGRVFIRSWGFPHRRLGYDLPARLRKTRKIRISKSNGNRRISIPLIAASPRTVKRARYRARNGLIAIVDGVTLGNIAAINITGQLLSIISKYNIRDSLIFVGYKSIVLYSTLLSLFERMYDYSKPSDVGIIITSRALKIDRDTIDKIAEKVRSLWILFYDVNRRDFTGICKYDKDTKRLISRDPSRLCF